MSETNNFYKKIPNNLTQIRFIMVGVLLLLFLLEQYHLLAPLFILAAVTDWLDGFLARRWEAQTDLGAFLDPVADKLIVTCALILIAHTTTSKILLTSIILIILREIAMSSLRQWASSFYGVKDIPVSIIGKTKTALQLISTSILLTMPTGMILIVSNGLLALAALLGWLSFCQYARTISKAP